MDPMVVLFIEQTHTSVATPTQPQHIFDLDEDIRSRMGDLEQELQFTRENLQATIEELETSNEELQATNEELLASNEELQSTNEELQSTNEELYTVNAEYQAKINELTESNNDVENLLTSSRIGTMLLDEDLLIRRYSPEAAAIFHILESDVGRPIHHLAHRLVDFDPVAEATKVQSMGCPSEKHVRSDNMRWYLIRITPYQIGPRTHSGVVLSFVDVTDLRTTQMRLERSHLLNFMPDGVFLYKRDATGQLILEHANPYALDLLKKPLDALSGRPIEHIWPNVQPLGLLKRFLEVIESGICMHEENLHYQDEAISANFQLHAFPLSGNRLAISFRQHDS